MEKRIHENHVYLPHVTPFLHAVTFLHVLHLDGRRGQIEIETESKNLCMAIMLDHPWQSLYAQYYCTV